MFGDKRTSRRRPVRYPAWLTLASGGLQRCAIYDISETGARIEIADTKAVPDRFLLRLSRNGSARRTCSVVWRKARHIGVKFERRLAEDTRASLVPTLTADIDATANAEAAESK
jgi:hypothetical protein